MRRAAFAAPPELLDWTAERGQGPGSFTLALQLFWQSRRGPEAGCAEVRRLAIRPQNLLQNWLHSRAFSAFRLLKPVWLRLIVTNWVLQRLALSTRPGQINLEIFDRNLEY